MTESLWMQQEAFPSAPRLEQDEACDIVVVGTGIAGLSVAYELTLAGRSVLLIDRSALCGGMTARTTAHLAPICDDGLTDLIDQRGDELGRGFLQSQAAAVKRIERHVRTLSIDCDFRRLDGLLFPAVGMSRGDAEKFRDREYEAAHKLAVTAGRIEGVGLEGFGSAACLRYPDQATFHPLRYLNGLLADFRARGGCVFANSPVVEIEEGERIRLKIESGRTITASIAIFATNSPINHIAEIHSKQAPYRTYAIAFEIPKGSLPDALYWDMDDPYHYVRLQRGAEADIVIAGGEDHKSGEANDGGARFQALAEWTRKIIPQLGRETARWSGQVMETFDYCGFIGKSPGRYNMFIVTGDSGQGMTHGALAGILIRDLIVSGSSHWEAVYDPARKPPRTIGNYISENLTAVKNFAEYVRPGEISSPDDLKPGEGGVMRDGLKKLAVCRDLDGKVHTHSASCTHMGCIVHWNATEQCWDCPCHGSQFAADGTVLNAPAIHPLESSQK